MFCRRGLLQRASLIPPGNLYTLPTDFANAAWTKQNVTIVANAAIAPDGSHTASRMMETSITNSFYVQQGTVVSGVRYNLQVYAKSLGLSRFLGFGGAGLATATEAPVFDLDLGVIDFGATSTLLVRDSGAAMKMVGNGWWRCSAHILANSTVGWQLASTSPGTNNTLSNHVGNAANGILIWGAHYKQA
jgi:hypothetical protein